MLKIIETKGDVLKSDADIICHQVNCRGVMGAGLALQIKNQYPDVYWQYQLLCRSSYGIPARKPKSEKLLGQCLLTCIGTSPRDRYIANLFGQLDCRSGLQTDYKALEKSVHSLIYSSNILPPKKIAIPKFLGCGLAGGDWDKVYGIFEDVLGGWCAFTNRELVLEIVEFDRGIEND